MRSRRSVTITPIFWPLRSLKTAMSFFARDDDRRLAGDQLQLLDAVVDHLGLVLGLAEAHVDRDLHDARDLHRGLVAELLHHRRA